MADNFKTDYAKKTEAILATLAQTIHGLRDLKDIWDTRLYGPGADNAISDLQLDTGVSVRSNANDLYTAQIFIATFLTDFDANAYKSIIDKIRSDF